jgi:glucose-6-phosphate 1-dehydrogenase
MIDTFWMLCSKSKYSKMPFYLSRVKRIEEDENVNSYCRIVFKKAQMSDFKREEKGHFLLVLPFLSEICILY